MTTEKGVNTETMRPPLLAPLFAPARSLKGAGPRIEEMLNKLVAPLHQSAHARVIDLLWHLPQGVIDRTLTPRIAEARIGELATLEVTVTVPPDAIDESWAAVSVTVCV